MGWRLDCGACECELCVLRERAAGGECLLGWLWTISAESSSCVVGLDGLQLCWWRLRLSLLLLRLAEGVC